MNDAGGALMSNSSEVHKQVSNNILIQTIRSGMNVTVLSSDHVVCIVPSIDPSGSLARMLDHTKIVRVFDTSYGKVECYNFGYCTLYVVSGDLFGIMSDTIKSVEGDYDILDITDISPFIVNTKTCVSIGLTISKRFNIARSFTSLYDYGNRECIIKCAYKS